MCVFGSEYNEDQVLNSRLFNEALEAGPTHPAWAVVPLVLTKLACDMEYARPYTSLKGSGEAQSVGCSLNVSIKLWVERAE